MPVDGMADEPLCDRLRISIAGVVIELEFGLGLEGLAKQMRSLWGHVAVRDGVTDAHARRTYVAEATARLPDAAVLRWVPASTYVLSKQITKIVIQSLIGTRILLHAGVVDHGRFGGAMLIGASGAGKSTATAHLSSGGRYVTDELAIIGLADHLVVPYPKPISRISPEEPLSAKHDVGLTALALEAASSPVPLQHVVLLDRDRTTSAGARAEPALLSRVPLGEALVLVVEQSSSLWRVDDGLAQLAALIAGAGGAMRATYREAGQLEPLLASPPPPRSDAWARVQRGPSRGSVTGGFAVTPYVQALQVGDEMIILTAGRISRLTGLMGVVWATLNELGPSAETSIEQMVVATLGTHAESQSLVRDALHSLAQEGVVFTI